MVSAGRRLLAEGSSGKLVIGSRQMFDLLRNVGTCENSLWEGANGYFDSGIAPSSGYEQLFRAPHPEIYDLTDCPWFSGLRYLREAAHRAEQQHEEDRSWYLYQVRPASELALFSKLRLKADFKASGIL